MEGAAAGSRSTGMMARAVLAGGFGDELFEPGAKVVNGGRGDQGEFVAAAGGDGSESEAERNAGVFSGIGFTALAGHVNSPW